SQDSIIRSASCMVAASMSTTFCCSGVGSKKSRVMARLSYLRYWLKISAIGQEEESQTLCNLVPHASKQLALILWWCVGRIIKAPMANSVPFDPTIFQGLPAAQLESPPQTAVRFNIVRDAAVFVCDGYFQPGQGSGTAVFQPNPDFRTQMEAMGIQAIDH